MNSAIGLLSPRAVVVAAFLCASVFATPCESALSAPASKSNRPVLDAEQAQTDNTQIKKLPAHPLRGEVSAQGSVPALQAGATSQPRLNLQAVSGAQTLQARAASQMRMPALRAQTASTANTTLKASVSQQNNPILPAKAATNSFEDTLRKLNSIQSQTNNQQANGGVQDNNAGLVLYIKRSANEPWFAFHPTVDNERRAAVNDPNSMMDYLKAFPNAPGRK